MRSTRAALEIQDSLISRYFARLENARTAPILRRTVLASLWMSLLSNAACRDNCDREVEILSDVDPPTLCSGELRFVDQRLQLNLAASRTGDDEAGEGPEGDTAGLPEVVVEVEGHTLDSRPAEFVNLAAEFMGAGAEDARKLASIEPGEQCRGGGRRVACTLNADGNASLLVRSTGLVPASLGQSETYYVVAYSGDPPSDAEIDAAIDVLIADASNDGAGDTGSTDGQDSHTADDELSNWDVAAVEVTLGLRDVEIAPLALDSMVTPSPGLLGCNSAACPLEARSQGLRFTLLRDGAAVDLDVDESIDMEVEVSSTSVAWLSYTSMGCGGISTNKLELSYRGDQTNEFLLCYDGLGGEVVLTARVVEFLPPERLPEPFSGSITVLPDVASLTISSPEVTMQAGESEDVVVQVAYCDAGEPRALPGAIVNIDADSTLGVSCDDVPMCLQAMTNDFGRATITITSDAVGSNSVALSAPSKDGVCNISVLTEE